MLHNNEFTISTFEHYDFCTSFHKSRSIKIYDLYISGTSNYNFDSIWCIVYKFVFHEYHDWAII